MKPENLTLEIEAAEILAAHLFAGKKDIRYYLCGVCLSFDEDGRTHITATDGHRLIDILAIGAGIHPSAKGMQAIIPSALLKGVKATKNAPKVRVTLSNTNPLREGFQRVALSFCGVSLEGDLIDGKFPDYERVLPKETDGKSADYNPDYLQDAQKALILLGLKYDGIFQNGTGTGMLCAPPYIRAAIMPWKSSAAGQTYRAG